METTPNSTGKLAEALAAAQGEMRPAVKDKENPFFKSKYADLASVWEAIRLPLSKHGLAVVQTTGPTDGTIINVRTVLMHSSGESISGELVMKPKDASPQGFGSCLTYARRYALSAMIGVCPDDDDDGNAASRPERENHASHPAYKPPVADDSDQPVSPAKWTEAVRLLAAKRAKSGCADDATSAGLVLGAVIADLFPEGPTTMRRLREAYKALTNGTHTLESGERIPPATEGAAA